MIPKKIHYCWFGKGEKDPLLVKCINSWKIYLPDYEIIEWNEDNFDINSHEYVKQAYECKVYAFVSDYVRLNALYMHGGVYLDTDMEIVKNIDNLLRLDGFLGFEHRKCVGNAIIGSVPKSDIIKYFLDYYNNKLFMVNGQYDLRAYPIILTNLLKKKYNIRMNGRSQCLLNTHFTIFSSDYFYSKNKEANTINITTNTYAIHHYQSSWFKFLK